VKGLKGYRSVSLLSLGVYLLVWKLVSLFIGKAIILPPPEEVLLRTLALLVKGEAWGRILATGLRALGGFGISLVLGVLTGLAAGRSRIFREFSDPFLISIRSIPVLSLILLAIIWFPTEFVPVFICFLVVYPVVAGAVAAGVRGVDPELLELARVYRKPPEVVLRQIILPSVTPYLLNGISTGLGLTWKSVVAAEILCMPRRGIGASMQDAQLLLDTPGLFAWTVVIVVLAAFSEFLIRKMERKE
jgi:NitT/TauT family transport system permease protein